MNNLVPFLLVPRNACPPLQKVDFRIVKPDQRFFSSLVSQIKLAILLMVFCSPSALAQIISGTSVIGGWDKDEIVVVADSRGSELLAHSPPDDKDCKIAALSNKFFIASTRLRRFSIITHTGRHRTFDAQEVARRAFDSSATKSASDVAIRWASMWTQLLNMSRNRQMVSEGTGLMFVGLDGSGKINGAVIWVSLGPDGTFIPDQKPDIIPPDAGVFGIAGGMDIAKEFDPKPTTPRAREAVQKWQASNAEKRINDPYAAYVIQLMRWVICYTTDSKIGGQPEAIELRPGGTVRWVQPCPAKNK